MKRILPAVIVLFAPALLFVGWVVAMNIKEYIKVYEIGVKRGK
jgi:hypothetical protein